jgi:pimeloyl-ACP methyl ester carboxylesterase
MVGPGAWTKLPPDYQQELIYNAPTYLDEERDPEVLDFDPGWITAFPRPVFLTMGDQSDPIVAPMYAKLPELLPDVEILTLPGAGHVPQRYQPDAYADVITTLIRENPS